MRFTLSLLLFGFSALANSAQALEFRSVGPAPIIMYDAPSVRGGKVYVAPGGMPVEIILTSGLWCRVRDMSGESSWVEAKDLVARRNVIVKVSNARIRASADENAAMVFSADKHVLLELVEPVNNLWAKVRHRDGQTGFVRISDIWGI
jgi:SH3-like domain-containing protein